MNQYRGQIKGVLQATSFPSATTFAWFGGEVSGLSLELLQVLSPEVIRQHLAVSLQHSLYRWFFCQGFAMEANQSWSPPALMDQMYVDQMIEANSGNGYYENGWSVVAYSEDEIVLQRDGLQIWASPHHCLLPSRAPIVPGMHLSVRRPKGSSGIWPGYYTVTGDHGYPDDTRGLLRIYWNLTAEGAVKFIKTTTSLLNESSLPFTLKAVSDPAKVARCDSVILYLDQRDYPLAHDRLEYIYSQVADYLGAMTPALTKKLADGVGLAEDPGQGDSFGMHRCRIIADGLITANEKAAQSLSKRLEIIAGYFAQKGITLDKPYLNRGSIDAYRPLARPRLKTASKRGQLRYPSANTESFLEVAARIGSQLCQQAIWHDDRCSWMGAEEHFTSQGRVMTFTSLGPDLYGGTSGIALFLAELYSATGDVAIRRTAIGAIRHALLRADGMPSPIRLGAYTGTPGVALVAAHLGAIMQDEELLARARKLVDEIIQRNWLDSEFDLLSGKAGAIVAFSILREIYASVQIVDFAINLGDNLLETAEKSNEGYSWKTVTFPTRKNLTGYAHGTAGVGQALLELFRITGYKRYYEGAQQAFRYERHWFNHNVRNWPDFREDPFQRTQNKQLDSTTCQTYWCTGAPGIALSRLRSYEVVEDADCFDELRVAVETTHKATLRWLESGTANYSLCHGLTGNSEVLRYGHKLGEKQKSELWLDVANAGIERYVKPGLQWPCGVSRAEPPGMMAGLAGIGYFYLSLHKPTVPSVLFLRDGGFATRTG